MDKRQRSRLPKGEITGRIYDCLRDGKFHVVEELIFVIRQAYPPEYAAKFASNHDMREGNSMYDFISRGYRSMLTQRLSNLSTKEGHIELVKEGKYIIGAKIVNRKSGTWITCKYCGNKWRVRRVSATFRRCTKCRKLT